MNLSVLHVCKSLLWTTLCRWLNILASESTEAHVMQMKQEKLAFRHSQYLDGDLVIPYILFGIKELPRYSSVWPHSHYSMGTDSFQDSLPRRFGNNLPPLYHVNHEETDQVEHAPYAGCPVFFTLLCFFTVLFPVFVSNYTFSIFLQCLYHLQWGLMT